jgi:hypothetical protein
MSGASALLIFLWVRQVGVLDGAIMDIELSRLLVGPTAAEIAG